MTLRRVVLLLFAISIPAFVLGQADGKKPAKEAPDDPKAVEFFEAKIRPVLVAHCYQCHSDKEGKQEGGLSLDSRRAIREGGDRGAAVVPGDPEASLLLTAISHTDPDLKMPPRKQKLPDAVVKDFETWIKLGAADPRVDGPKAATSGIDIEAGRKFWSFRKPLPQAVPTPKNAAWAKGDIDRFVLEKLEETQLAPSHDADAATLLRRLHFDLVGLPPSPVALSNFESAVNSSGLDAALASEVDALLASPQFGERWGRHWLDVARFAESSGKEANVSFPYAFRYRDYVIDAVNADLPFDRFLVEQIAGDLLPYGNDVERARLLIATGFLALGPKNLDEANAKQFAADLIDEQIDTVTRAVMANSVACARCHDHKFDPYSMQDYYALAGIFVSTKTYFGTFVSPTNRLAGDPLPLPLGANQPIFHASISAEKVAKLKADLAKMKKEQEEGMAKALAAAIKGEDPSKYFTLTDALRIFWSSGGIEGQLEKVDDEGKALPLAMGVLDADKIVDAPFLERGDVKKVGERVSRAFPQVIELPDVGSIPADRSGRLEFARWLTHPDHPLTARVMVNRIWRHLFGAGIVKTVDNFGFSGDPPSHPELLDYLALKFTAQGWSVKGIVRELVLSRAYRQSSDYRADAFRADPENRLLWRAAKRRLDAEQIRDAMLAASGEIDLSRPAGSLVARVIGDRPISLIGLDPKIPSDLDASVHRSVYLPVIRDRLPDVLDLFDFAEPSLVTGDRETTNVPVQALYLMNSPFVQTRATGLADRLLREAASDEERIRRAFVLCLSRPPDAEEMKLAAAFFQRKADVSGDEASRERQLLAAYCQALLATAEFRVLD
jgi:hypothetical protein